MGASLTPDQIDAVLDTSGIEHQQSLSISSTQDYCYIPASPASFDPTVTIESDAYDGPMGKGYTVTVTSDTYQKVLNFGPDTVRELPWTLLEVDDAS